MGNCGIFGEVNFGEGPVRVYCTKQGNHDIHVCQVLLAPDATMEKAKEEFAVHKNVFEENHGKDS